MAKKHKPWGKPFLWKGHKILPQEYMISYTQAYGTKQIVHKFLGLPWLLLQDKNNKVVIHKFSDHNTFNEWAKDNNTFTMAEFIDKHPSLQ